jgi:hypothetical protein
MSDDHLLTALAQSIFQSPQKSQTTSEETFIDASGMSASRKARAFLGLRKAWRKWPDPTRRSSEPQALPTGVY